MLIISYGMDTTVNVLMFLLSCDRVGRLSDSENGAAPDFDVCVRLSVHSHC